MVQQVQSNVMVRRGLSRIGMSVAALVVSLAGALGVVGQANAASPLAYTEFPFTQSELSNWHTDRTTPSGGYEATSYAGRTDTLKLSVDTTNPSPISDWYWTEGLQRTLPAGSVAIRADAYVPSNWVTTNVRAGLWGVGASSDNKTSSYPIIEFTTAGENGFTGWRWWNGDDGGWHNLAGVPYKSNDWNKLAIVVNDHSFDFYVNNKQVATYASPDSVALSAVILNSRNYADQGANYDVYWSRFAIGHVAESPTTKSQCAQGGWVTYGFSNQGQCVRFVETNKDSRL